MTTSPPPGDGLDQFRDRLRGGIYPAIRRNRPASQDEWDRRGLQGWPGEFPHLGIRASAWGDRSAARVIGIVTQRMRTRRSSLAAVLFSPDLVLDTLRNRSGGGSADLDIDTWTKMCLIAEAAWEAVTKGEFEDPAYAAGDAELLRPVAARVRFLVLTEPMRWRGETAGSCWAPEEDDTELEEGGVLNRIFGPDSWHLLVARSVEARRAWLDCLDVYQSHPLLSQAEPGELEQELAVLVFRQPRAGFSLRAPMPLGLLVRPLAEPAPLTTADKSLVREVTDRHLLPRFALSAVIRLAFPGDRSFVDPGLLRHRLAAVIRLALPGDGSRDARSRVRSGLTAALAVLAALAAVGLTVVGVHLHQATIAAAVFYLLVCIGVVIFGSDWAAVWLLRMPAASAVGIIALVSFLPGDWLRRLTDGWLATLALTAVSFGYLVMEVRNHGVARWASMRRALVVTAVGAAHALMVSLIGLVVVAPAFVGSGPQFASLWRHPGYRHAGMLLALATAWCLAVGVFSQILWDDRPITALLAHLSWRNRLPMAKEAR